MVFLSRLHVLALVVAVSACDTTDGSRGGVLTAPGRLVGERVALDGDAALLGAPGSNEAFVFDRSSEGWARTSSLGPTEAQVPDPRFGQHLDIEGDYAVVGAPENDVASDASGHAYVYARGGGGWVEDAVLRPDDLDPDANFGSSVSISGGALAVGAGDDRDGGRVHVFERTGGAWSRAAVLTHPDPGAGRVFGLSVALDGGRLAVAGSAGPVGADGRVFVFERGASGGWTLDGVIEAPPLREGSFTSLAYGLDLALDGPTLVANEPGRGGGTVYVYRRSASGWSLEATLSRSREELGPLSTFGFRVALSGDRVVAAVPGREVDGQTRGSAIVYVRGSDAAWTEEAELQLSDPVAGFGRDVAIDGETVLVGANDGESQGGAYVFARGESGWMEVQ